MDATLYLIIAIIVLVAALINRSYKASELKAQNVELGRKSDRYQSIVDSMFGAVDGIEDPTESLQSALEDDSRDVDSLCEAMSFVYSAKAIKTNLDEAARQSRSGIVRDYVEVVRQQVTLLESLTEKFSEFFAFTPGNILEEIAGYEKAGNVVAVQQMIASNLNALAKILAPFKETNRAMDQLGVTRQDVGIVPGDVMDTLLTVASRLPETKQG